MHANTFAGCPASRISGFCAYLFASRALICRHTPDELDLPFALWSRGAVRALIRQCFGVRLVVRTVGTYLARWVHHPEAIAARAKAANGVVFWDDEIGLRSDDVRGLSYAPWGRTPVIRVAHKRAGLGLISAVANKGELRWMVLHGAITSPELIRFLARLVRDVGRKVFLVFDRM